MKKKNYTVSMRVTVDTDIELRADSYEEALEKARQMGVKDIVEFDTSFNDGSVAVIGVWNHGESSHG